MTLTYLEAEDSSTHSVSRIFFRFNDVPISNEEGERLRGGFEFSEGKTIYRSTTLHVYRVTLSIVRRKS